MDNEIKYDSVEDTEKYREIKDELEKKINSMININRKKETLGYCHIYWNYKKAKEKDYDIVKCKLKVVGLNGKVRYNPINNIIKKQGKYYE